MSAVVPDDFDYAAEISFLEIRDQFPLIDPESLAPRDVLAILLHLFQQKPGFLDRGRDINNAETACERLSLSLARRHRCPRNGSVPGGGIAQCRSHG